MCSISSIDGKNAWEIYVTTTEVVFCATLKCIRHTSACLFTRKSDKVSARRTRDAQPSRRASARDRADNHLVGAYERNGPSVCNRENVSPAAGKSSKINSEKHPITDHPPSALILVPRTLETNVSAHQSMPSRQNVTNHQRNIYCQHETCLVKISVQQTLHDRSN